jgi:hypothetical protein
VTRSKLTRQHKLDSELRADFERIVGKRARFTTKMLDGAWGVSVCGQNVQPQVLRCWWKRGWIEPDGEHAWLVVEA